MNTFDGSSPVGGDLPAAEPMTPAAAPTAVGVAEPAANGAVAQPMAAPQSPSTGGGFEDFTPDTLLDQIAAEVAERDEDYAEPWVKQIPRTSLRLVCDPRIENEDYQRWIRQSMPHGGKNRRGPRNPSITDMNQLMMSARAIIATNIRIDVLHKPTGEWRPLMHNGEEMVLDSDPLLHKFGAMDPIVLLRRLFGRDADLIDAGQELLSAAGYLDGDGDDEDPSPEPVGVRRKKKR